MKQNILVILLFISFAAFLFKTLSLEKKVNELQIRLDEQELLNKIGKELISSKLNIR